MKFRDFHINIKIRIVETFLSRLVGGMVFPFMAIYLASHFSAKLAGILLMFNVIVGAAVNFLGGYYSDIFGRKKLMAFAEVVRFLAFATMALANSAWFELPLLTFFMMTINSICWGLAGPANQAMLIDVSTPEQRKLMYSITYWATNLSIALGAIVGGFFFKTHLFELFVATASVAFLVSVLVVFFIKESFTPTQDTKPSLYPRGIFKSYGKVLEDRLFVMYVLAGLLIFTLELSLTNYMAIRLTNEMPLQTFFLWQIDGVNMVGFLRTENTILVVLTSIFAAKMITKFKDGNVLIVGSAMYVIGYSAISYFNNIWVLFAFMLFTTIGEVIKVPVQHAYLASIPPAESRSTYMAINGLTFNGAMLVSSLFVTLSAFLPSIWMSILLLAIGMAGVFIYATIIPELEGRKQLSDSTSNQVKPA
ncbi:MDR family MFS transporter [Bacillus salitolerans]|uniref:MDR family MFS transporter n=1 Tax=Bacillus salitolerans TaxID=1437434 RepID=A0ABW4LQY2_9BACI